MKSKLQLQPGPILDFGASPMLAMRKLIIPAGHRALGCLVRVRKRSGAGRGRGAGRRRGTCGARMPNGLAVSEASAWMAVTEASEGEDNVGYGDRHPGNLFGGRITYNVIRGYKYTQRSEDTLTQHTLVTRCRSACSPPLLRLRDSRKTVHSVLSCFVARRPDPTRSEVSTEHKKAPFPPGGPSFSFTNKVQASIVHPHTTYPLDGAHPHLPPPAETTHTG